MPPAADLSRLADQLRRALPPQVIVETTSDASSGILLPDELETTQDWVLHRRLQFAAGRTCARRALARLGYPQAPILFDEDGAPRWPPGAVGSISHKRQHCIVVVAPSAAVRGLGVDLERDAVDADEAEIARRVCRTASEQRQAATLPGIRSASTLFLSAKESFFKFQFPVTRMRLEWEDIEVVFADETFSASVIGSPHIAAKGRFVIADGWIATACL